MLLRIIVADPDLDFCKKLSNKVCILGKDILLVDIATDGPTLIKKASETLANVILFNTALPGLSESDCIHQIRRQKKVVAFIAMIRHQSEETLLQLARNKIDDIVLHPLDDAELSACLQKAQDYCVEKRRDSALHNQYKAAQQIFFDRVIMELDCTATIEMVNKKFYTRFIEGYFRSILVRTDYDRDIASAFYNDMHLRYQMEVLVRDYLDDLCSDFCVKYCTNGVVYLVNYPAESDGDVVRRIQSLFRGMSEQLNDEDMCISLCVSRAYANVWECKNAREETLIADWARMAKGPGQLVFCAEDDELPVQDELKIEELTGRAQRACTILDVEEFDRCVEELFRLPYRTLCHNRVRLWLRWLIDMFFTLNTDIFDDEMAVKVRFTHQLAYARDFKEYKNYLKRFFDDVFHRAIHIVDKKSVKPIRLAVQYVHEHYREKILIEDVAQRVNISVSYFSTLFKLQTGSNFTQYVANYRIEMAKKLLRESDKTIFEIAEELGFTDQRYFSKTFKKSVGITPTEFRKAND